MQHSSPSGSSDSRGDVTNRPRRPKRLLIIGRRGRGKSSLCNLLLHGADWRTDLPVSHAMDSVLTDLMPRSSEDGSLIIYDTTGFDASVDRTVIIREIQTILSSAGGMDGILFLMPPARCDLYDIVVFELYLQIILCSAPNTAVGVVFTGCSNVMTEANSLEHYMAQAVQDTTFVNFRSAVLKRCNFNVCFVNNPHPEHDGSFPMTRLREASRQNVLQLVDRLSGTIKLEGVFQGFLSRVNYWIEHLKENQLQYMAAAVPVLLSLLTMLLKK